MLYSGSQSGFGRGGAYALCRKSSGAGGRKSYFRVVRAAFAQRRKTLLNCLRHGFPQLEREDILACLEEAGIGEKARGETLGLEDFARLTKAVGRRLQKE